MARPPADRLAILADPGARAELDRSAQTAQGMLRTRADWAAYVILEAFSAATKPYAGRTIAEVAAELGKSPWDTLADIVAADELRTVIATPDDHGQDDRTWERRAATWRDPRVVIEGSDAGAHLDMIDSYSYCTTLLAQAVRKRRLLPLEEGHPLPD